MKIVQCWDDGVEDDIRLIEILRKHGAKASFNLNWNLHGDSRSEGWNFKGKNVRRLARQELKSVYEGFLVANHSLTHPHLEQIAPEEAQREITENRDALENHFGYAVTGFAYPFGTYNDAVKELIRQSGHVYARGVKKVERAFPPADPMEFQPNCHFLAPDFWQRVENAGEVFYFWGHSYEILDDTMWADFESQIARLSALRGAQWVNLPSLF